MPFTTSSFLTAANQGSSLAPQVTIPTGAAAGWKGYVVLSENAATALNSTPSFLTLLDSTAAATANMVDKIYTYTVGDGSAGTVTAGTLIQFGLSASRQWAVATKVGSGVLSIGVLAVTSANLTTMIMPTFTTTQATWVDEVGVAKSNGVAVTAWTPPAGMTLRATATAGGTSGTTIFIADSGATTGSGVAVGGETYTPNQAINTSQRYLIGWVPVPVTLTFYPCTGDTTTTGWSKNPSGASSFASVLGDADDASYAETSANPSALLLDEQLADVAVPTDLNSFAVTVNLQIPGGTSSTWIIRLLQSGTVKKSMTLTNQVSATSVATFLMPLTSTELGTLTVTGNKYQNLRAQVVATVA